MRYFARRWAVGSAGFLWTTGLLCAPGVLSMAGLFCLPGLTFAQRGGASSPSTGAAGAGTATTGAGANGGTRGTYGNFPGTNPNSTQQTYPQQASPIFLSGQVLFDDGSTPNSNIRIERVCNGGNPHLEAHTDSRGRFYLQLGQNFTFDSDAADSGLGGASRGPGTFGNTNIGSGGRSGTGGGQSLLWTCDLRASYPGYTSDTVRLAGRQPLDQPDVGTIVLHHLGVAAGTTVSATTALAPKNAQKAYQKGLQLAAKGKLDDALEHFKEATNAYPKYAIAWYALGQVQQRQGQSADARKSYEAAVAADSHYVNPYDQMARLAGEAGNWEDAAKFSKQAISLNPVEFPSSFWYNAIANYQLKRASDAEQSVQGLLKIDTRHNYPQAENLMGQLLLDKGRYNDAASHLKNYLALSPNASNAAAIKEILNKISGENALTKAAPTTGTAPPQQ